MKLGKLERVLVFTCPWIFGMVLVIGGIITALTRTEYFVTLLLICSGLICISLYCVCVLLLKIVEK